MAVNVIEFFGLIKELISNEEKMNKFREIVADIKELINDIKDILGKQRNLCRANVSESERSPEVAAKK